MRRIGWAIALAAAWLTPAAAQAPASSPAATAPAAAQPTKAPGDQTRPEALPVGSQPTPPGGFAQNPNQPEPGTAPATMAPTPGIGEPDGRMSLQDQVSPIGQEAAAFHNNILLFLCAIISVIVLALLLWVIV